MIAPHQHLLDTGQIEARNLAEGLSVHFPTLLESICPEAVMPAWEHGITRKMWQAAESILAARGHHESEALRQSKSDTVRGIAAILAMLAPSEPLTARLKRIRPYADDPHFAVREWAWMAARPHLAAELTEAIEMLVPWTAESSAYLRRFAIEATRPRGVWCAHIESLKAHPAPALPLLEPLKADPEKYVQDSVSNWLNDAAKTQPDWVRSLCDRWQRESPLKSTARIVKRALRSLD